MNLELFVDIVQIVTAMVAVITLFLLYRQIVEANRTQRTSQYQTALQLMFDWRSEVTTSGKAGGLNKEPLKAATPLPFVY
ncbi:MAG: hypothetical protein WCD18_22790 [Thermosynechococcaceae cyanobacterium]